MDNLLFLLKHAQASKKQFLLGMFAKICADSLVMVPWLMIFSLLLSDVQLPLWLMAVICLLTLGGQWLFGQAQGNSFSGAYQITHKLRQQLLNDIRKQPLALLINKGLGERINAITTDLKHFEDIFSHLIGEFAGAIVVPVLMVVVVSFIQPVLGVSLAVALLMILAILPLMNRPFSKASDEIQSQNTASANQLLEYIELLPTLKAFGASDRLAKPLNDRIESVKKAGLGLEWAGGNAIMPLIFLLELLLPFAMLLAAFLLNQGQITANEWLVVVAATAATTRPLAGLSIYSAMMRYFFNAAARLAKLAKCEQQNELGQMPKHFDITLDKVGLDIDQQSILRDINARISASTKVAFVGPSGAGKSSLLNLLAAFRQPSFGSVKIGGLSIDEIGTNNLYQMISYITQDVQLLSGSLKDNILVAKPDVSDLELSQAVSDAGLSEVVERLPGGINGQIGENGNLLSGGERQRLSIARALLKDSQIILLDEVTSALDEHNQQLVLHALNKICQGKTVLSIAHRLNTIIDADAIYLINNGQIDAVGSHQQLLQDNQLYQQLWQAGQST